MLLVWFELQSDTELWAPTVLTLQTSSVIPLWWPLDWKPTTIKHKKFKFTVEQATKVRRSGGGEEI
jgi:hypothetical protein